MLLSATVSIIVVERDLSRTLEVLLTVLCSWLFPAEVATVVVTQKRAFILYLVLLPSDNLNRCEHKCAFIPVGYY